MAVIGAATRIVFLTGDPIGHTRGYEDYARSFATAGIDAAYLPAHVPPGGFRAFLDGVRQMRNLAGVVCTIPHKREAFALSRPDATARRAGSANLLRPADGGWDSTMLDGTGFRRAVDAAGIPLAGRRVQQLGAGGAGRAVAMAIAEAAPARLALHDPDPDRAAELARDIGREFPGVPVALALDACETLVNCSPVGMGTDARLPLPEVLIPAGGFVYDIVNRPDTPLMQAARARGSLADHGRSMMLAQMDLLAEFLFRR